MSSLLRHVMKMRGTCNFHTTANANDMSAQKRLRVITEAIASSAESVLRCRSGRTQQDDTSHWFDDWDVHHYSDDRASDDPKKRSASPLGVANFRRTHYRYLCSRSIEFAW